MGAFSGLIQVNGRRWNARLPGGAFANAQLDWPGDFPGFPYISEEQTVLVDRVRLVLSTVALPATARRPRLILLDQNGNKAVEWQSGQTVPNATVSGIVHWSKGGVADAITGGVLRSMLPSGLVLQSGWSLYVDWTGGSASDTIDELVIGGDFLD